jgi:hypothetical protein
MAEVYNLFYQGDFCNVAGDDVFVKFYRKMDSGSPVPTPIDIVFGTNEPVRVDFKEDGERKLQPIYGSAATIIIKAIGDFELKEMYSEDERTWKCIISGAFNWQGWVQPDGCYEPYGSKPYDVTVRCTDALGTLKTVPFLKDDNTKYTGYETDRQVLFNVLAKTGLSLPIGHAVNTFESTMTTTFDPLAQTFANTLGYLDVDGIPISCYDVLKAIMERWSCVLRQVDGMWQMVNVLEKSRGDVNMWVYNADNTLGTTVDIGNEITAGGDNRIFSPSDHNIGLAKGYKASLAYYKYGYPSNELVNSDFNDATPPALPNHWVTSGVVTASSASVIDPVTGLATTNKYLIITNSPNDDSFVISDTPVLVRAGDQLNVTILTRCDDITGVLYGENRKIYIDTVLQTEDGWYFTEDSGWQTRPDTYRIIKRARDVVNTDLTLQFAIAPRNIDYTLIIGLRAWEDDGDSLETKFDNVELSPTNPVEITKPPVGVYHRQTQGAALTFRPDPILLLHSDDANPVRNSRLSIGTAFPVTPPVSWNRGGIPGENQSLLFIVANSELRMHKRTYQIFEAQFTRNDPDDTTRLDPNTIVNIDLLNGKFLMLSGTFNLKSMNHVLRLAEIITDDANYYNEIREDYGTEKGKDGISIGSPSGVTPPPVNNGTGENAAFVQPEIIPFDWDIAPVTEIDMTINGRNIFGKYPNVEIWNVIDDDNESLYPGQYAVNRVLTSDVLTEINFPDLDMEFAPSQKGYFKLSK